MVRRKGQHKGLGPNRTGQHNPHAEGYISPPDGRNLWTLGLDGAWSINTPTTEDLLKHAEKFGTEQIAETAVDLGYDLERLIALITRLDLVEVNAVEKENAHHVRKRSVGRKQSAERRAKKLLNWVEPEEGESTDGSSPAEEADAA